MLFSSRFRTSHKISAQATGDRNQLAVLASERDLSQRVYGDRVNQNIESGLRSSVTQTPALFIHGVRYTDA